MMIILICTKNDYKTLCWILYSFAAAVRDLSPHFSDKPTLEALKSVKTGVKLANVINDISKNGSLNNLMSKI